MPRSSEAAQRRQSPRVPLRPKPAALSDANSLTSADRRTSRTLHQQKQRRSRVADLETKLGETMVELKLLKQQLDLEESAKKVVSKKLEKTKKEKLLNVEKDCDSCITSTDTCEEVAEYCTVEKEVAEMRVKLAEKEKEFEAYKKVMETKLAGTEDELKQSKEMVDEMKKKMEFQEGEKELLEAEMKRLRIQSEQWRKASETAAAILDYESYRSVRKPVDGGGGGGMRALGELWKKRGQQK